VDVLEIKGHGRVVYITNFHIVLLSSCLYSTVVIFLQFWSFHIILFCSLFLSYSFANRVILGGKDDNVRNWWCVFHNKWYQKLWFGKIFS